jgi:hypothetical protein
MVLRGGSSAEEIGAAVAGIAAHNDRDPDADPIRITRSAKALLRGLLKADQPIAERGLRLTDPETDVVVAPVAVSVQKIGGSGSGPSTASTLGGS